MSVTAQTTSVVEHYGVSKVSQLQPVARSSKQGTSSSMLSKISEGKREGADRQLHFPLPLGKEGEMSRVFFMNSQDHTLGPRVPTSHFPNSPATQS